jgi:hypothetical protein
VAGRDVRQQADPAPSAADVQVTRQLREAAKALDIELLDHAVVGNAGADPTRFLQLPQCGNPLKEDDTQTAGRTGGAYGKAC